MVSIFEGDFSYTLTVSCDSSHPSSAVKYWPSHPRVFRQFPPISSYEVLLNMGAFTQLAAPNRLSPLLSGSGLQRLPPPPEFHMLSLLLFTYTARGGLTLQECLDYFPTSTVLITSPLVLLSPLPRSESSPFLSSWLF